MEYPYFITEEGEVWNKETNRFLKTQISTKGYECIRVTINGVKKTYKIHREVAKAYIPNPENKPQINHIDGNKLNNKVSNLEWCTQQENVDHAMKNGLWVNNLKVAKESNERRKKKIIAKNIENSEVIQFDSVSEAEKYFNTRHITDVLKGKRSHAKGYHFSYLEGGGEAKWI